MCWTDFVKITALSPKVKYFGFDSSRWKTELRTSPFRLSQLLKHSKKTKNLSRQQFHTASVSFFGTCCPVFLFQSHSGGAHPILLTAERSDTGGGREGGWGHAGWPWAASQERWWGSEPLRWTTCSSVFVKEKASRIELDSFLHHLPSALNSCLSHTLQVVCRGNCQLPWRLSEGQRWWSWTNPPREWTPIPGDPFGTSYWNTELVRMSHQNPSSFSFLALQVHFSLLQLRHWRMKPNPLQLYSSLEALELSSELIKRKNSATQLQQK